MGPKDVSISLILHMTLEIKHRLVEYLVIIISLEDQVAEVNRKIINRLKHPFNREVLALVLPALPESARDYVKMSQSHKIMENISIVAFLLYNLT